MLINYALLDDNNIVKSIAVFNDEIYTDETVNEFAKATGYAKAINCQTYEQPYVGDTWDEESQNWIETAPRVSESVEEN